MMNVLFVGSYDLKGNNNYAGEAIKTKLLFQCLSSIDNLSIFECKIKTKSLFSAINLCYLLITKKIDLIFLSKFPNGGFLILKFIKIFLGNNGLKKTIYFLIGNKLFDNITCFKLKLLNKLRFIVVENTNVYKIGIFKYNLANIIKYGQIKNVVDFPNKNREVLLDNKPLRILYFSRIMRDKGIFDLISALKFVRNPFILDIYGYEETNKEEHKIFLKSLADNIKYCGIFKGTYMEKLNLLYTYDLHILPSYHEGIPGVVCECNIVGTPSLIYKFDGYEDCIDDSIGYLCDYKNIYQLGNIINNIALDRKTLLQKSLLSKKYSKVYSIKSAIQFINSLINSKF